MVDSSALGVEAATAKTGYESRADRIQGRLEALGRQKERQHEIAVLAEYLVASLQIDPAGMGLIVALAGDVSCKTNLEAVRCWVERRLHQGQVTDPDAEVAALRTWLIDSFSA